MTQETEIAVGVNPTRRAVAARIKKLMSGDASRALAGQNSDRDELELFNRAAKAMLNGGISSIVPLLGVLFTLRNEPYSIKERPFFSPVYRTVEMPLRLLLLCARQTGKSSCAATYSLAKAATIPFYSILFAAPLFEMTRRFSQNTVRPLIEQSPLRNLLLGTRTKGSVLQREFANGSTIHFTYAFKDAERSRGLPIDELWLDEVQNMMYDLIPLLRQTTGASPWKLERMSGTPKGFDNSAYALWSESSQAEWAIKCPHGGCGHYNFPSLEHDLLQMIGKWRADISPKAPGLVCAKCQKPVSPRPPYGRWVHRRPQRKFEFAGYHIPQTIVPDHCEDPQNWALLLNSRSGADGTPFGMFLREKCAETYDEGEKLVTLTDLEKAMCLPWENKRQEALKHAKGYQDIILSIDWGGGGGKPPNADDEGWRRLSFTVMSVLGLRNNGGIDVIYAHRSLKTHDPLYEAALAYGLWKQFNCSVIVHDFSYAGDQQHTFLVQAGMSDNKIINVRYSSPSAKGFMVYHKPDVDQPRGWYSLVKSSSLAFTCEAIKCGVLRFAKENLDVNAKPALIKDFLSLVAENIESKTTSGLYVITKDPRHSDDFAQSVNIGCHALWYKHGAWPNLSIEYKFLASEKQLAENAAGFVDWNEIE